MFVGFLPPRGWRAGRSGFNLEVSVKALSMTLAVVAVALGTIGATTAEAQAGVEAEWAQQFMGSWNVQLDTPDGQMPVVVSVREAGGQVVVVMGNGQAESEPITNVSRSGETLVASYEMEYQGMPIDATIRLQREGEGLSTDWSFAGGAYQTQATGTRR